MLTRKLTATLITLACASSAHADGSSAARVRAFAKLPDWSGIWQSAAWPLDVSGRVVGGEPQLRATLQLIRPPPYNASSQATYEAGLKNTEALARDTMTFKACTRSFPALMEAPWMFQVAVLPEETMLIFENDQVRHIRTDGRPHPDADSLWPMRLGDSVGHWDGDTLVIDTIARKLDQIAPRAPLSVLSEAAHFTERLRRVSADRLEDDLTIDDPALLAHPWHMTLAYTRVTELTHLFPYDCTENERNPVIDGKMQITVPP